MKKNTKHKKIQWQSYIAPTFLVLMGAVCGFLMVKYVNHFGTSLGEKLFWLACLFVEMYIAIVMQIVIHEVGHLIFGLLSGYKFSSFRIFSFMLLKEENKLSLRRLSIAGTGGQCLMSPPDMVNEKIPVTLYNLGGSLMNIITSMVFLGGYFLFKDISLISILLLLCGIIGVVLAIVNGIPLQMGTINNDGYNAFTLTRNKEALRSFWIQMKVNEQLSKGIRLKDMPEEWFQVPSDTSLKNSMVVTLGVFACNRLMDQQNFSEADKLMKHLLTIESGMVGIYRNLMICDRLYIELITENRKDMIEKMLTKEQQTFMKQMKKFPSVLRTEYALAVLNDKDVKKSEKIKGLFEQCAKTYPYQTDVESERELMEIVNCKRWNA